MCCGWKINSLWLWWYCLVFLLAEGYLMYRAVQRCQEYNELSWREDEKPVTELYVYILLIVVSIMCVPFVILTSLFKIGNYANDGMRLGRDDVTWAWLCPDSKNPPINTQSCWLLLWKHIGPLCQTCHIIAALTLLLPSIFLESREIEHGFKPPESVFHSDVSLLIGEPNEHSPLELNISTSSMTSSRYTPDAMSLEFVNLCVALLAYSCRYAAVYWYTSRPFSAVFSAYLFLNSIHALFSICATTVLYKLAINSVWFPDITQVLPPALILGLHLIGGALMFLCSPLVFQYGFYHYSMAKHSIVLHKRPNVKVNSPEGVCHGFTSHIGATVLLVIIAFIRGPLVYQSVRVYQLTSNVNGLMLTSVLLDVFHMLFWIALWLTFTLRQSWSCRVLMSSVTEAGELVFVNCAQQSVSLLDDYPRPEETPATGQEMTDIRLDHSRSSFKKSNCNKNGHVTFENDAFDECDGSVPQEALNADDVFEVAPNIRDNAGTSGDKIKTGRKGEDGRRKNKGKHKKTASDGSNGRIHQLHNDLSQGHDNKAYRKSSCYEQPEGTPENTLVRHYRHSIRNKCGQYYRHSKEIPPPPPASNTTTTIPHREQSQTDLLKSNNNIPYSNTPPPIGGATSIEVRGDVITSKPRTSTESGISSMSGNTTDNSVNNKVLQPERNRASLPQGQGDAGSRTKMSTPVAKKKKNRCPSPTESKTHKNTNGYLPHRRPEVSRFRDIRLGDDSGLMSDNVLCSQV